MRNPLKQLSARLGAAERFLAGLAACLMATLILINVFTRSIDAPIYWIDEAAVFTMIWMVFIGGSATFKFREQVAVTLVTDNVPGAVRRWLNTLVDLLVLVFAVLMMVLCWLWYDPLTLASFGFELSAFSAATFNFMYDQPTATLGIATFWIWLVLPIFSINLTIHALSNLLDTAFGDRPDAGCA
ncbi:MAG: TRAP transporter small permease [Kiloniellales bacterium]|nr:TRAP transporter small permease [Kiloniellales bacterium]